MNKIIKNTLLFRYFIAISLAFLLSLSMNNALARSAQNSTGTTNAASGQNNLTIYITGIRNDTGVVRASLYNSPDGYATRSPSGAYRTTVLHIRGGTAVWRVKGLPTGDYAVLFYHDEDNDGVFRKNFLGIPQEGYGFSGGGHSKTSVPSWGVAKFHVDGANNTASMTMLYW